LTSVLVVTGKVPKSANLGLYAGKQQLNYEKITELASKNETLRSFLVSKVVRLGLLSVLLLDVLWTSLVNRHLSNLYSYVAAVLYYTQIVLQSRTVSSTLDPHLYFHVQVIIVHHIQPQTTTVSLKQLVSGE